LIDPPTVFGLFRPRQPKLPSAVDRTGPDLLKRYPVVCWVYTQSMFVFEQIVKYFRLLGAFLDFFGLFAEKS
jgi:hypothetical protein